MNAIQGWGRKETQSAQSCKNTVKSLNVTPSRFGLVILEVQPLAELISCNYYEIDATGIDVYNIETSKIIKHNNLSL